MASSVVVVAQTAEPAVGGLSITYSVAFQRDDNSIDMDVVTVLVAGGDTPNAINSKISTAVRNVASMRGYNIPANGIAIPAYSKG